MMRCLLCWPSGGEHLVKFIAAVSDPHGRQALCHGQKMRVGFDAWTCGKKGFVAICQLDLLLLLRCFIALHLRINLRPGLLLVKFFL